mgnify:CR=1 FL=1
MKEIIYTFCYIPNYFNKDDTKRIKDNYNYNLFPKKKLIISFEKNKTFTEFLKSIKEKIKKLKYHKNVSRNILLIDGRIELNYKLKCIKSLDRVGKKIYIPIQNVSRKIKEYVFNSCRLDTEKPFFLYSFLYIEKDLIEDLINGIQRNTGCIFYDDSILLKYLHNNIQFIEELKINYRINDYPYFTMKTFGKMGRLGNQIFQWMFLNNLCKKYKRQLKIPYCYSTNDKECIHLEKIFDINLNYLSSIDLHKPCFLYKEKSFNYNIELDKIVFDKRYNYDFFGYFQSEKYFKNINVKNYLKIKKEQLNKCLKKILKYKKIKEDSVLISIHIRRGDLIENRQYGPSISTNYIKKSINYMREKYKNIIWLIFSDDLEWCESIFRLKEPFYYPNGNLEEDFITMSLCEHHIISNSTYSWWASYLNSNKDKKVICPKVWFYDNFLPKNQNDKDLIPKRWYRF